MENSDPILGFSILREVKIINSTYQKLLGMVLIFNSTS
ncbi:MAG: hypothetical protein ACI956_001797, partial [Nonlabens sp.]